VRRIGDWSWKEGLDLPGECEHIVQQAQAGQESVVNFGCLMLVALASRDAYMFDLEDKLACVLCRGGERTRFTVRDQGRQWAFEWPYIYEQRGGRIWLFSKGADDTEELLSLRARDLEHAVRRYNQQAGTNYHL